MLAGVLAFATAAGLMRSGLCSATTLVQRPVCTVPPAGPRRPAAASVEAAAGMSSRPQNVLGGELQCCCLRPRTGFYRDGFCQTGEQDAGRHTVCAIVSDAFLQFSRARGNDLTTPMPEFRFPGLKSGDRWCLCVLRWKEALDAGVAPRVVLDATHAKALDFVSLPDLESHAGDRA
jgi:uncharacterized protein